MDKDKELRSTITSTTGGVMCREAGAATGELEVSTRLQEKVLEASVRYVGAGEWYAVEGSPVSLDGVEHPSPEGLHERLVGHLTTPGPVVDGNEQPVSLKKFSHI